MNIESSKLQRNVIGGVTSDNSKNIGRVARGTSNNMSRFANDISRDRVANDTSKKIMGQVTFDILINRGGRAKVLPLKFYQRDTTIVAKELLGKRLVHRVGEKRLSGIIVETEAYTGPDDAASHAFRGRKTSRNLSMYEVGGTAYVYFIYGMYFCINAVTQKADCPEAVLIRALQPAEGIKAMTRNRGSRVKKIQDLTNGPGKLCQALEIDRAQDGLLLNSRQLFIEDIGIKIKKNDIVAGPRIGVHYAGHAAQWPLRFMLKNNLFVSKT